MADKLTPQQEQAVYDRGGKLLVSAAAGSGKTKVLVDRLLTYLTQPNDPANLDDFLIITYTKAAAAELRGKIAAKLTERIAQEPGNRHLQKQMQRLFLAKISTVHGFCGDLLREYAYKLDIPADFRIADESECRELREMVLTEILDRAYQEADPYFSKFADSQGLGRDDRMIPMIIERVYDSARCHLHPEQWLADSFSGVDLASVQDVSETTWGKFLVDDLHHYLTMQIAVIQKCADALAASENLEKPASNFRALLDQLQDLLKTERWDEIVQKRNIVYDRLVFPRKNVDTTLIAQAKASREACKKGLERKLRYFSDTSEQILLDLKESEESMRGLMSLVRQFEQGYDAIKRRRRVLDFSDLEHKTLDLLLGKNRTSRTAAATEIGRRFREILVDEYQDSNAVQDAIFSALTEEKQNCFMVGDVKQSIYQFRLADPGIFLAKYHDYVPAKEAKPGIGRKVFLSHNFRSGAEIIDCVNDVFRTCMSVDVGGLSYGEEEKLREGVPHDTLPDPAVELHVIEVRKETYPEEAAFVAERIQQMLRDKTLIRGENGLRQVKPEDIVILLRSPGSAAGYFVQALESRGIRCNTAAGTNLLKCEEISILRAFLQIIVNPRLDIPLISVLASPLFCFTADDLALVRSHQKKGPIYDALLKSDTEKTRRFLDILRELRKEARMSSLTTILERCFQLTRADSIFSAKTSENGTNINLQTFFKIAADFESGTSRSLVQFLEHLESLEENGITMDASVAPDAVRIMSIHKSKGLEFPVVFLSNLSRSFNMENTRAEILCDKTLGVGMSVADTVNRIRYPSLAKRAISVKMSADSVSEEMRVLYVAMTRARDRLVMTYAAKGVQKDLELIANRYDFDNGKLLCRDAASFGDWILLAAMLRTEAGELHTLGGKTRETFAGTYPWKICLTEAPDDTIRNVPVLEQMRETIPETTLLQLKEQLNWQYSHVPATKAPSKQTATDRKGREKDSEVSEDTDVKKTIRRSWRQPSFIEQKRDGTFYGNAIHAAMHYLSYENCGTVQSVREEIRRLTGEGFLSEEQAKAIDCERIAGFFQTHLGQKLSQGVPHLREFKFSLLDHGSGYGEGLSEERVLLQGVVDCALLETDGITVIDFKTDSVTEESLESVTERYRIQVDTYGEALSRIYELPIKAKYLYFFRLDRLVQL